jgi:hypothetical protein
VELVSVQPVPGADRGDWSCEQHHHDGYYTSGNLTWQTDPLGNDLGRSGSAGSAKPLWLPDASALVSLAAGFPLQQAAEATRSGHRRVLVTAVVAELEELAKSSAPTAAWAAAALSQLDWLGEPVRRDDRAGTELAVELQGQIAVGRP